MVLFCVDGLGKIAASKQVLLYYCSVFLHAEASKIDCLPSC